MFYLVRPCQSHTHTRKQDLVIIPVSVPVVETTISAFIFLFLDLLQGSELIWSWPGPLQPERKGCEAGQRDHQHVHRSLSRLYVLLHPAGQHGQGLRPRHRHPVHHQDFRSAQHSHQVGGWCLCYPPQTTFSHFHVFLSSFHASLWPGDLSEPDGQHSHCPAQTCPEQRRTCEVGFTEAAWHENLRK